MPDLIVNVIIGLVTGLLSGVIVYVATKRREEKTQIYQFWFTFLFGALRQCEIYIPVEILQKMSPIGGKDSEWHKAIFSIIDDTRPFELEDREATEQEERISNNVMIALKELDKWKNANHIHLH